MQELLGKAVDSHTFDANGVRIEGVGNGFILVGRVKSQATDALAGQKVQNLVFGTAVGVGGNSRAVNCAVRELETNGEGTQFGAARLVVSPGNSPLDTIAEVGLRAKATAQDADKSEQLFSGFGVGYNFGVADGVGEQVQCGFFDRVRHGCTSFHGLVVFGRSTNSGHGSAIKRQH